MMKVKKSLEMAKAEALKLSKEHPTILYRVMDKKGQMAVCTGSDWYIGRESVMGGSRWPPTRTARRWRYERMDCLHEKRRHGPQNGEADPHGRRR